MNTFLKLVAQDLYHKQGDNLARTAVIFPNKRASLFFNEHLAEEAGHPIWSPAYLSISELFSRCSKLKNGDSVKLVCELYKVFCEETHSQESLDEFYFWGELLISDFDEVDKNLVDTDKLFSNLKHLKSILNDYTFISPEQEEAIRQFFQNFSIERRTQLKEKFISLWDTLGNIYNKFNARLSAQGIAYEGMLYRTAIHEIQIENLPYDRYVFIGFNVLNKVEFTLFKIFQKAGKAMFYWDYDQFYLQKKNHEAGEFIRRNLKEFPNELSAEPFDSLKHPKHVCFISTSTENAQARFIPAWVNENASKKESESAIVLCNESLLLPILHSIPDSINNINITMGFPLAQTPVYSFINALLELHTNGFQTSAERYVYTAVSKVLKHPYTRQLSPQAETLEKALTHINRFYPTPSELKRDDMLALIFTPQLSNPDLCTYLIEILQQVAAIYKEENNSDDIYDQLYRESLFKAYTIIARLNTLIESNDLLVNSDTFKKLINKILLSASIPFHGEPAIGMQIMGVLETRNLDFSNLVVLSLNEGQLPKNDGDSSFIPYNLRKAFGMTTIEHKNAIYAYYFYRLLQRAENITLLYNSASDGLNRGEWSRFMLQFLIEWPHKIKMEYLQAGQSPQKSRKIIIKKTPAVMRNLQKRFDIRINPKARVSPSALNCYIDCPVKFYFQFVAKLELQEEVNTSIDSATFGSIFHYSAELLYKDLTAHGKMISQTEIEELLKNEVRLQNYVDAAFKKIFFKIAPNEKPEYNGTQLINSSVIVSYLKQLLRKDALYAPFTLEGMEVPIYEPIEINTFQGTIHLALGGIIDRMDSKENTFRIVDYKTGGSPKTLSNIEELFTHKENRPNYIFQTFFYASLLCQKERRKIAPSLLYIHKASAETYSPIIEIGEPRQEKKPIYDFIEYHAEFRRRLIALLEEIFDPKKDFSQTEFYSYCEYCNFRKMCKR